MGECPQSKGLLARVVRRLFLQRWGARWQTVLLVLAGLYAMALLVHRLTGLIRDPFHPLVLVGLPVAAALISLLTRKPSLQEAARSIDQKAGSKDLFLTLTLLDSSAGAYQPLVTRDAEGRAANLKPSQVVPLDRFWHKPFLFASMSLALLAAGGFLLPTLDPFGKVAEGKQQEKLEIKLFEEKKSTEIRKAQLADKETDKENSEDVKRAVDALKTDFQKMKRGEKQSNNKLLVVDQKTLGEKYQLTKEQLKNLINHSNLDQKFGQLDNDLLKKMEKELQQGSSESFQKQMEQLQQDLQRLAKTEDPVQKSEMERKIQKQMKEMSDFAGDKAGSKQLAAALQRAMEQMETMKNSKSDQLTAEAMKALGESMDLAKMEMKSLAQAARDMKSLEEAMKLISMAKQLNNQDRLDGEQSKSCQSMEDYEDLYKDIMAQMAAMQGQGEGDEDDGDEEGDKSGMGKGTGNGSKRPEDDSVKTAFKNEKSTSTIQKGKILLSIKSKGLSDDGEVEKNYQELVHEVSQNASEAIETEQVPPGYHDGIKKYFNSLDKKPAP